MPQRERLPEAPTGVRALVDQIAEAGGLPPSALREMRRAVRRWSRWAQEQGLDPLSASVAEVERYAASRDGGDRIHWTDLSGLRRYFATALAAGLREEHPLPYRVRIGIPRRRADPLARLVHRVALRYGPLTRATISSDLSAFIDRCREMEIDPLDLSPQTFGLLIRDQRQRERIWRALGILLFLAGKRVGPHGRLLLARIERTSSHGARRLTGRWRSWALLHGYRDPGRVPPLRREQFLAELAVEGADRSHLEAMRAAIRELEMAAERRAERPPRFPRQERLVVRLAALGLPEAEAARRLEAVHGHYRPSGHRGVDAVLVKWLEWSLAHGVASLSPTPDDLTVFRASIQRAYGYLGAAPVRHLLAASVQAAVPSLPSEGAGPSAEPEERAIIAG